MKKLNAWALASTLSLAATCSLAVEAVPAGAADPSKMDHAKTAQPTAPSASAELTDGEVRKIDAEQGKITIKHGAIKNLDMPPMTMVFRAASADMLAGLKPGDAIRFRAESDGGFLVTRIEKAK